MELLPEQYDRGDTSMTQYDYSEYGEGYYRFVLITPDPNLAAAILDSFCISAFGFLKRSDGLFQYSMFVLGPFAWEMLTALLDEVLMGAVWGQVIEDIFQDETN